MNPISDKKFHRLQCLIDSCKSGDDRKLKYILESEDCDGLLDSSDQNGRTLLHYCTEHENVECASLLISKRPQLLTLQDDDGCSPLHLATISGNVPLLEFLIKEAKKGLEEKQFNSFIDCYDNENHTAYHWATVCGELSCIKVLQAAGADPSLPDIHGAHPIHYASQLDTGSRVSNRRNEVIEAILSYAPTERDARDKDGRTPLLWAASSGNVEAVETLTKMKANVAFQDHDGLTALHCAASRGYLECIECLIELCGSPVDQTDSSGASALFYAVTLGHADCSQFLLHEGAAPNRQDRKGRTPAHCGAAKGQLETMKILYQNGGNLWLKNTRGDLPLHEAVKSGRKELVRWLLDQLPPGSDFPNTSGKTPLHVACFNGNIEMCQVLIDYGMDLNAVMKSKNGWMTPLDVCLLKGFRSCAKFILLHGALPASKLPNGDTFRSSSNQDALLETESHSSSQSFIKEVRVPSKTHLQNITKTVTSQRVHVYTDGIATPNSCVETTLSTDSRPETIITNVYVNTCTDSRKKSTLSKLIRKRSKKRSQSQNNSSGRNSEVRQENDQRTKTVDNEAVDEGERYILNETILKTESQPIDGLVGQEEVRLIEYTEQRKENEHDENQNEKSSELIISNYYQDETKNDGDGKPENSLEGNLAVRDQVEPLPNGEIESQIRTNEELSIEPDIKTRSKRSTEDNDHTIDEKDTNEKDTENDAETTAVVSKHENELNQSLSDTELEKGGSKIEEEDDKVVEAVEYAQVLTDKLKGSGEVIDKLLSEMVKDELSEKGSDNGILKVEDKIIEEVDEKEGGNDETLSEGGLESEAEIVPFPKSYKENIDEDEEPNKVTFHDTDSNSLHDSVSADETIVASVDDPAAQKVEMHSSSTAFEIRDHMDDEGSIEEERKKTSVRRKKSTSRSRKKNHCTHKYHFKQSFTTIQPLDLQHVRPKVDTGRSSSCTKSYSRSSDHGFGEFESIPATELLRSDKSLRKYYTERKLFEELRELKRCQIRSDRTHERILVKRLIDTFEREIDYPGIAKYTGSYDYKSYERFLYDQLRQLSQSNHGKLKKHSSEENVATVPNLPIFQQEGRSRRSCSAEHLNQEKHQADRFLPLEDRHPIQRSPQPRGHWEKQCYHKVNSDIVRTAESLDYAIITRDGSSNIFRKETAIKFEPHASLPPLSSTSTSRLRNVKHQSGPSETSNESRTHEYKKSKTVTSKNETTINHSTVKEESVSRSSSRKTFSFYSSGGSKMPHSSKPVEMKRKKTLIPRTQKPVISEEEISRRWKEIKEHEKHRKSSNQPEEVKTRSSPNLRDYTLIYEVNGTKSAPHRRKRVQRTTSEPRVTKTAKPKPR